MTPDDICPGLSLQPVDVQLREVIRRTLTDYEILSNEVDCSWRRHQRERLDRIGERLELICQLVEQASYEGSPA